MISQIATADAGNEVIECALVAEFNQTFGYDLLWPLDDFTAENAAQIAELRGKPDLARSIRQAFGVK